MWLLADDSTSSSVSVSEGCICFQLAGGDSLEPAYLHSVSMKVKL